MIKSIQFDSKRLGELSLDFSKPDGTIYKVIVLAGENGCGKTSILDSISYIFRKCELGDIDNLIYAINNHTVKLTNRKYGIIERIEVDGIKSRSIALNVVDGEDAKYNIRSKGFAYSKARSGFKLGAIKSVSAKDIDADDKDYDDEDYSDVKQLLIDIDSIDSKNFYSFSQSNTSFTVEQINQEFNKVSRTSRFKNAFNNFFENIKFDKIGEPKNNSFPIYFKKNGKFINIDSLSTGEKQIVCRGGRLLKNIGKMDDGIVLIDEPELSLHPRWQRKILNYYCDLFKKDDKQIAQLFIATHSEYVIESALKNDDCLVIVLKDDNGVIKADRISAPDVLDSITSAEINYKAFNIYSTDYHDALYSFYQQKKGTEASIENTDNEIFNSSLFDSSRYFKNDTYERRTYRTLPTYIRNAIHHPDSGRTFTYEDLKESTELLRLLCI